MAYPGPPPHDQNPYPPSATIGYSQVSCNSEIAPCNR